MALLTVWIPLDHDVNDSDISFAKSLGSLVEKTFRGVARFAATETRLEKIGIVIWARDLESVFETIRPFLQQHCPRNSFVTGIWAFNDEGSNEPDDPWAHPQPVFEGEKIIAT